MMEKEEENDRKSHTMLKCMFRAVRAFAEFG